MAASMSPQFTTVFVGNLPLEVSPPLHAPTLQSLDPPASTHALHRVTQGAPTAFTGLRPHSPAAFWLGLAALASSWVSRGPVSRVGQEGSLECSFSLSYVHAFPPISSASPALPSPPSTLLHNTTEHWHASRPPAFPPSFHQTTQADLHRHFYGLGASMAVGAAGAGVIEEVRVRQEKGFGFVRYATHEQAAAAIEAGNGSVFRGRLLKVGQGMAER